MSGFQRISSFILFLNQPVFHVLGGSLACKVELHIVKRRTNLSEQPHVTIEYFVPDEHKEGGSYQSYTGNIKRIEEYEKTMVMTDGKKIQLNMIRNIIG
jgi:hypothetical protein